MSGSDEVLAVAADLVAAWNRGDARGFAALFAGDAEYVAGSGAVFRGREAIARLLADATRAGGSGGSSTVVVSGTHVRMVREDVAIVRSEWRQVPQSGGAAAARRGIFTLVAARASGRWEIVALQNTDAEPGDVAPSNEEASSG